MSMPTRSFVKNCPDFLPEHEQCNVLRWTGSVPKNYAAMEYIVERFAAHLKDFPEPAIGPDAFGGVEITNDQETTFKVHVPSDAELYSAFMTNLEMLVQDIFTKREILEGVFCSVGYYFTIQLAPISHIPTTVYLAMYWEFANEH